jgi:uncharacterized protein YxjI
MASSTVETVRPVTDARPAVFERDRFVARQKMVSMAPAFFLRDESGAPLAFLRQEMFTWKDDIRVFSDETQAQELLRIRGRKVLDFGAAFDVTDSAHDQKVGVLKRQGWKSFVRAEWKIFDAEEHEVGAIREDSLFRAMVRRFLGNMLLKGYSFELGGEKAGTAKRVWNFFVPTMKVDFSNDPEKRLDRRMLVAAVVLLMTVERNDESN